MKAYVIKGKKDGKYFSKYLNYDYADKDYYKHICGTKNIINAKILKKRFDTVDDFECVEITIAEGDLEHQLAEKDEIIKELNGELAQIYSHLEVEAYLDQQTQALKEIDKLKKKTTTKFEKLLAEKNKEIENYAQHTEQLLQENAKLKKNYDIVLEDCDDFQTELDEHYDYFISFGCKNFEEFQELIGLTKISKDDKELIDNAKHQVCEEIKIKGYHCHNGEEKYYKITPSMLWEIEQGESK